MYQQLECLSKISLKLSQGPTLFFQHLKIFTNNIVIVRSSLGMETNLIGLTLNFTKMRQQ